MIRHCIGVLMALQAALALAAPTCTFKDWKPYQSTKLLSEKPKGAYLYVTQEVKVDADGAPNAYHPADVGLHCTEGVGFKGLDCPANGGYPHGSWWRSAILPDPRDNRKGYVQPKGEFAGYFVSQTSLRDNTKPDVDPQKYVDARTVPYVVFPGKFHQRAGTGSVGDVGYAVHLDSGKASAFVVAEVGPPDAHLGEMSIALGSALGGSNPNPRTGAGTPKGKVAYVVFPYTKASPAWPLTQAELDRKVGALLSSIGGLEMLKACTSGL